MGGSLHVCWAEGGTNLDGEKLDHMFRKVVHDLLLKAEGFQEAL